MEPLEWSIAMNSIERDTDWYRQMVATSPNKMDKIEQIVDYISKGDYEVLGMPGDYMSYSNEGYALLSYVVESGSRHLTGTVLDRTHFPAARHDKNHSRSGWQRGESAFRRQYDKPF